MEIATLLGVLNLIEDPEEDDRREVSLWAVCVKVRISSFYNFYPLMLR